LRSAGDIEINPRYLTVGSTTTSSGALKPVEHSALADSSDGQIVAKGHLETILGDERNSQELWIGPTR
jgi:hypothetical protein